MSNHETFEPMGLVDLTKEVTKLKQNRKRLDDMTERLQSALDAKRDASSMSDELQEVMKRNQAMWQAGYDEGYKAGRNSEMRVKGITDSDAYIPVDDDGVWKVSVTTMNMLYSMFVWANKHNIDNEDDWEGYLMKMHDLEENALTQELVSAGISVEDQDKLVDDVVKMIEDKDEDEPDQYPPEQEKWGGTK